jgi:hypothetical protein
MPATSAPSWKPASTPLSSQWASTIDPAAPWPEHPRPQLARDRWTNLNGLWDYAIVKSDAAKPTAWNGQILVPFAIESSLSGVGKRVGSGEALWYRRSFEFSSTQDRLLLNFGAVDWQCEVWVNGTSVGTHTGGFDPFTFDITDAVKAGSNELVLKVIDPTDDAAQPRGKQVREPNSIWYTPVTGIWQTVWLEPVPAVSVASLKITPDVDASSVTVLVAERGGSGSAVKVEVLDGASVVAGATGKSGSPLSVKIPNIKTWSPDSPFIYDLRITLPDSNDVVKSYFGMRKIALAKDSAGHQRLMLNNRPIFMFGPLDQGWWPDGLYTAPSDEALRYDIEITRKFGFNMARKHIKLEPARWYYWADKLGLLVWQDMPSGGITSKIRDYYIHRAAPDAIISDAESSVFKDEWKRIMDAAHNYPSIVVWVPINEGWFQHRTDEILAWTKQYDPTRLVDGPSGWTDRGTGDLHDMHNYPGPDMNPSDGVRASVLGEFGGLGWPMQGHLWQTTKNWGYITYADASELEADYRKLCEKLIPLAQRGLTAAVYTQTTDVEGEVNGLMTYDRKVLKLDPDVTRPLHEAVMRAATQSVPLNVLAHVSREDFQSYRVSLSAPSGDWKAPGFDDSRWTAATGAIGSKGKREIRVGYEWTSPEIWIRRSFTLKSVPSGDVYLRIVHDDSAEVFINGVSAGTQSGIVEDYQEVRLSAEARNALKVGENVIAVHAKAHGERRVIDFGLFELP